MTGMARWGEAALGAALMLCWTGCHQPVSSRALVLAEKPCPPAQAAAAPTSVLALRYPAGSRVVLVDGEGPGAREVVLSRGLHAAGDPYVSADGRRVLFAGQARPDGAWQIYEGDSSGGTPVLLTDRPGGAMNPCLLKDGRLVFASPVPGLKPADRGGVPSQIFTKRMADGMVQQLSFMPGGASQPTILEDGRILFVGPRAGAAGGAAFGQALYTMNNDGTEVTGLGCLHDPPSAIGRPRLLPGGQVVFLRLADPAEPWAGMPEVLDLARPLTTRRPWLDPANARVTAVEPGDTGVAWVCQPCAPDKPGAERGGAFSRTQGAERLQLHRGEAAWSVVEAVSCSPKREPLGRFSNMDPAKDTGLVLCLDANETSTPPAQGGKVARLRVFTASASGQDETLGEVSVQADGSFLAEMPADVPLGFETLDQHGAVLQRQPPVLWVRAGENRTCVGCHEAHFHSPRNVRPRAVETAAQTVRRPSKYVARQEAKP